MIIGLNALNEVRILTSVYSIMSQCNITRDINLDREFSTQLKAFKFGVSEVTPGPEFEKMLKHSLDNNKPLRVKCGIDPTAADVHLGHLVPYRKMRQFQDLGHTGVVIVGDYTASIGDPTGKVESRPALDPEVIKKNTEKYMDQLFTVLDPDKTEIRYQSEWFQDIGLVDVLKWASQTTVAKLLSHDTFANRLEQGNALSLHELFYPMLQGIDSVFIKADVELGGSDQKFNVLMGRDYQRNAGLRPQVAILLPIITGTCGTQKMSKSLGNYIGILDRPFDKFGKTMSIPDEIMLEWYKYLTGLSEEEYLSVKVAIENGKIHPNEAKKALAQKIVSFFHGEAQGASCRDQFETVFKKKLVPDELDEYAEWRGKALLDILAETKLVPSKKEGRRMIGQNAVGVAEGEKLVDPAMVLDESFKGQVLKVGKRKFLKLT